MRVVLPLEGSHCPSCPCRPSPALRWLQVPETPGFGPEAGMEGGTRPARAEGQGHPATGHLHLSARREGLP